jgi:ethanolamine transporter EutH
MKPWIKAGLITAGIIVLISTFLIGQQVEKLAVQRESLNVDSLYIVSVLLGASLIAIGLRIKSNKSSATENSAK